MPEPVRTLGLCASSTPSTLRSRFTLRFPSGAFANCATSYSAFNSKDLRVQFERGWAHLENAYAYRGQQLRVAKRQGEAQVVSLIVGERLLAVRTTKLLRQTPVLG